MVQSTCWQTIRPSGRLGHQAAPQARSMRASAACWAHAHSSQIVQSKRPFDSYYLQWEGRRRVGEGIHCTALEQVTRKVLDAYTVRTRVRVHAYGYTFIARYAHDSTVTVRGSSVHLLAVAMAFAPPASKHALPLIVGGLVEKSQLPYQAAALAKRYLHECTASVQGLGSHLEHH